MLRINIVSVNCYLDEKRGFLLSGRADQMERLQEALRGVDEIEVAALRQPSPVDLVGLRHGRSISWQEGVPPIFRFVRDELELLIDFLGEELRETSGRIYGLRGTPKVGKTEAAIAACVHASKRWILVSGTMLRQTLRTELTPTETGDDCVLFVDAATSVNRPVPEHRRLVEKVLRMDIPKIVEHPDLFIREGWLSPGDFRMYVELRRESGEPIDSSEINAAFSAFDLS
jgi:hypothetical protein